MVPMILALWACGGDEEGEPTPAAPTELTFVTFNAGLARGFVPGADSRQADVGAGLATVDADVICLQEVWQADQVSAIASATTTAFPHQFFPAAQQSSDAICNPGELDALLECFNESCDSVCTDQVDDCLLENCPLPFALLPKDCMRCAMANVGQDADGLVENCEVSPVEYAYDGSFGTGILSKHPISSVDEMVFVSTSNRRSLLHAVIDTPEGPLDVYCTHLTAAFSTIPYPRAEGDWVSEQATQIRELNEATADASRVVLLGDLNTGPAINGMDGETPENWEIFEEYDWTVPYLELDDPLCTYCGSNALIGVDDSEDRVIDHVMLRGFGAVSAAGRMLDALDSSAETCGTLIDPAPLSDHYGVSVTVAW
jgi:endonuclease/exonuclease/phosphatase family metal-dependent hydrolase